MAETRESGISYIKEERKIEVTDLKLIEHEELERAWKNTVRERQKNHEQRIWEDFCKNKDSILKDVLNEDPYLFIDKIPAECMEEFLQSEANSKQTSEVSSEREETVTTLYVNPTEVVENITKSCYDTEDTPREQEIETVYASGDRQSPGSAHHSSPHEEEFIPSEDLIEEEPTADLELKLSVPEAADKVDKDLVDKPPCTVREHTGSLEVASMIIEEEVSSKCESKTDFISSNKANTIMSFESLMSKRVSFNALQSTLYFDKVGSWRTKINEVLLCIIELFELEINNDCDPVEMNKQFKRASEFSNRFTRIYVYQLQRQLNDLRRHTSVSLPFGKRTQFQAQVTRVLSLHQNTLQALQMLHQTMEKSLCLGAGGQPLQAVLDLLMEASDVCRQVVPSTELLFKVGELYNDEIPLSCTRLVRLVEIHIRSVRVILDNAAYESPRAFRTKPPRKERDIIQMMQNSKLPYGQKLIPSSKISSKYASNSKTSVSSLDNMRLNLNKKSTKERITVDKGTDRPGTSVSQLNLISKSTPSCNQSTCTRNSQPASKRSCEKSLDSDKKKNRRKPVMRSGRRAKARKRTGDEDIVTMVETMQTCPTSRSSPERPKCVSPNTPMTLKTPERERSAEDQVADKARAGGGRNNSDVTALLHRLCASAAAAEPEEETPPNRTPRRDARVTGANNAQLVYVRRESPRARTAAAAVAARQQASPVPASSTPQLLKILEENIQKQCCSKSPTRRVQPVTEIMNVPDKYLLQFTTPAETVESCNEYRKKYIEYMMSSPLYLNNTFNKPWEVVGRVSDKIVDDILLSCATEMQLDKFLVDLYNVEVEN